MRNNTIIVSEKNIKRQIIKWLHKFEKKLVIRFFQFSYILWWTEHVYFTASIIAVKDGRIEHCLINDINSFHM